MDLIRKFLYLFNKREKHQGLILLVLMLFGAIMETLGIGLLVPFVGIVGDPATIQKYRSLSSIYTWGGFQTHREFVLATGIGIAIFFVVKNVYLGVLTWVQNRFLFAKQVSLCRMLMATYLLQPYTFHLQRNSSEVLRNLTNVGTVLGGVLIPLFAMAIEAMVMTLIMGMLLRVAPGSALIAIGGLAAVTIVFYRMIRVKIKKLAEEREIHSNTSIKWINQSVGGIKETKVLGRETYFLDTYVDSVRQYGKAFHFAQTTAQMPKLFIESLAMNGIVLIICLLVWQNRDIQSVLPTLALFALATIRVMPSMSRVVSNVAFIRSSKPALDQVYLDIKGYRNSCTESEDLLWQDLSSEKIHRADVPKRRIKLLDNIELKTLSYRYPGTAVFALENISLTIPRHQSIALIGPSGAGKTTLVDVILGLLQPEAGGVFVDGRNIHDNIGGWQESIGYIPQTIYLLDDSIRKNIAYGIPDAEIDDQRVRKALRAAQLETFVTELPQGLDNWVGERGVRISGGQRQRIGIARALYHDPEVLILDEATSALDHETEAEVTRAIESLSGQKTIIVIAHRLTTAQKCDRLYKIQNGRIVAEGTYQEVCGNT